MGLVTRCPECRALFRVSSDQLDVAEGWVCCGLCGQRFDGRVQLYQSLEPHIPDSMVNAGEAGGLLDSMDHDKPVSEPDLQNAAVVSGAIISDAMLGLGNVTPAAERFSDHLAVAERSFEAGNEPGFMSPAMESAPPRRSTQLLVGSLGFVFFLALVVQVMLFERSRIAIYVPAFQSFLKEICTLPACAIEPLRDKSAIAIDSSSFVATENGNYLLSVALKNSSIATLAMPSIELTLTDALEQSLVRKVLMPADFESQRGNLTPGGQWTGSANLRVDIPAGVGSFSGYRLVAFYP
jgi:predicted Zn finger-like uncharacterized protein